MVRLLLHKGACTSAFGSRYGLSISPARARRWHCRDTNLPPIATSPVAQQWGGSLNVRLRPIADISYSSHHPTMKVTWTLALLIFVSALSGCTRAIDVKLSFRGAEPVLTFYKKGWFPKRLDSVCLWTVDIVDSQTGKIAMRLNARDGDRYCARVPEVSLAARQPLLVEVSPYSGLIRGRSYHAEIIADEGIGISHAWTQP